MTPSSSPLSRSATALSPAVPPPLVPPFSLSGSEQLQRIAIDNQQQPAAWWGHAEQQPADSPSYNASSFSFLPLRYPLPPLSPSFSSLFAGPTASHWTAATSDSGFGRDEQNNRQAKKRTPGMFLKVSRGLKNGACSVRVLHFKLLNYILIFSFFFFTCRNFDFHGSFICA